MICENCKKMHDGIYGSGRFCSSKCAHSFSTKEKRNEINDKVSKTLTGRGHDQIVKYCIYCKKKIMIEWFKRKQQFCSQSCATTYNNLGSIKTDKHKEKISASITQQYNNGKKVYGGKTKWYTYKNIKVQGTYELRACKIFDKWKEENKIKDWEYTNDRIPYMYNNKQHNYLLDFKIINNDNTFYYIEIKGYKTDKDIAKWKAVEKLGILLQVWYNDDIKKYE